MSYEPLRFLDASEVTFETGAEGELVATVAGVRYEDVKPTRTHPLTDPDRFVSLSGSAGGKTAEFGVLKSVAPLSAAQRALVENALARRYLGATILIIHRIREEFGFMYWDVTTDRGDRQLVLPRWVQSHVVETGSQGEGRVVLDVWGNRALIPDVGRLDERSRVQFERFVHW